MIYTHCVKYTRRRVFYDPNLRFCPYMGKHGSDKTRILSVGIFHAVTIDALLIPAQNQ